MERHYSVIPLLQRECKLFKNIPLLLSDNISVVSIKSEHIGAIIAKKRSLAEFISGKTKCILIESGASSTSDINLQNIALIGSFVLNVFAKSGATMCVQAFQIKYNRSHKVIDFSEILSIGPPNYEKYEVDTSSSPQELKTLYTSVEIALAKEKSLSISLKRFNGSLTKTSIDDKLIDMCICLESIFNVQSEINFRFSLYNAILSEKDPARRFEVFELLKNVYKQRSNIVHGNKAVDNEWVAANWDKIIRVAKFSLLKKFPFFKKTRQKTGSPISISWPLECNHNEKNDHNKKNKIKSTDKIVVPAIKARVLGIDVVRGFAALCDLARISEPDIYDAKTNPEGTQRDLSPKHARDAYLYVQREDYAFWPEVFLALRDDSCFSFDITDENTGYGLASFDLKSIKSSSHINISRVDGNHRLHFADGGTEGYPALDKIVSFCLAVNITAEQEIKLFRDINNNQRRMNTSHLDNIKLRLDSEDSLSQKDPMLYIANKLKSDEDSPLNGLVYDGGRTDINKFIPLRTLKTGIEYMFSRPTKLTALEDRKIQSLIIKNYFMALKKWEPDAWKYPKEYLLLRGSGFWGACFLGAEVIDRVLSRGNYRTDDMLQVLKSGIKWDWTKNGNFQGLSGRGGAVKIRDMIASEFADEKGISLKAVMKRITDEM